MKKFKRLNRKGFTLVELLAVIVILAVVMVIASTSVLSAMNSSKQTSLLDSAKSAANALTTATSESILNNSTTVYGLTDLLTGNATTPKAIKISDCTTKAALEDAININSTDYDYNNSYVSYNGTKVSVCFSVGSNSKFYVSNAASTETHTLNGITIGSASTATVWACSDGEASWNQTAATS